MSKLNPFKKKKPKVDTSALERQKKELVEQEKKLDREERERNKKLQAEQKAKSGRNSGRQSLLSGLETGVTPTAEKRKSLG